MSLINDALNRAQAEASTKESVNRGEVPPVETDTPAGPRRHLPAIVVVAIVLLMAVALMARRWASVAGSSPEPTTVELSAEPIQGTPQSEEASASESSESRSEAAPRTEGPRVRDAPGGERPAPAEPSTTLASQVGSVAEEAETTSDRTPDTQRPAAETPGTNAEAPSEGASAAVPTTIWPADGGNGETWYFVGKVQLAGGGEIVLGGIAWSELAPSAMLNGSLLTVGSEILGLRVASIAPRTVMLEGQGQRIALQLGSSTN